MHPWRCLAAFRWRSREAEMTEEIRLHLEQRTREFMADGLAPTEARRAALRRFGGVEQVKELARAQRPSAWLEGLVRDVRLAARSLLHAPGFTITALLTLALGLGANTTMFSLVDALLLRPPPYLAPDRLIRVYRTVAESKSLPHSLPEYRDLREQTRTFASLTAYQGRAYSLADPGQPPEHLAGILASAELFATLGVQPALGRGFTAPEQEPGRDGVAVLSYHFWQRQFAGDPQVIGRSLRLDGELVTIIGVMPESAAYPLFWGTVDVWRPLPLAHDWREQRSVHWLNLIGRLQNGIPPRRAQAEFAAIADRLARQFPDTATGAGYRLIPLAESAMEDTGRQVTWLTFGLAGLVLLIACANLSSLQLARTMTQSRQFAVRVALGAPRRALIRQSLVETLVLAATGGVLGIGVAVGLGRVMGTQIPLGDSHLIVSIDARIIGFAALASIVTGVLFGAVPAWVVSRSDANSVLKQQSRGSTVSRAQHRLRHLLLVSEIALTLVLLASAAVLLRGLHDFARRDLGWTSAGLLTGSVTLPENRYPDPASRRGFHERLQQRIERLPGEREVALASALPITATANAPQPIYVEGRPTPPLGQELLAYYVVAGPHFFKTLGTQLIRGRLIPDDIRPDSPAVAVISESTARTLWPGEDPIGKRISRLSTGNWEEVIGVVRDVRFAADLGAVPTAMQVYESLVRDPWGYVWILVRSDAPDALSDPLRRAVAEIDPDLSIDQLRTIPQAIGESQHYFRLANQVLAGFAALGVLLSAIGLYGVISGLVARRTPEFGIRLALGAQPRDVLWAVLAEGLKLSLLGVVIGLLGGIAVGRLLSAIAPAVPTNPVSPLMAVSLLLIAVAALACWIPARRATKLDPVMALRTE